jgi:hypothetical protein
MNHSTLRPTTAADVVRRSQRRTARRALLAHARWQVTFSQQLLDGYTAEAGPLMRALVPALPLVFGRRGSRSDRIRRRVNLLRRRLAATR